MNNAIRDQVWPAVKSTEVNPCPTKLRNGYVESKKDTFFLKRMKFWHENVSKCSSKSYLGSI